VGVGIKNDQSTRQPVEGDVVDADRDFSGLCSSMRETGRSACTAYTLSLVQPTSREEG
jgi:hypothetical protein